jgi:GT2 family glycosyltransferase
MSPQTHLKSVTIAPPQPLVCACVITYNGKRFLPRCFETIQQRTDYGNFRLVLVDNGSSDGSGDYVRENFSDVDVLRIESNAGYARAANRAVEYARKLHAKYVVIMNDDIAVVHSEWLREAIEQAERDPHMGIITFVQITSENEQHLLPQHPLTYVDYLDGFVMMLPVELVDSIGGYDEEYFSYGEEDDLGARAQAGGYKLARLGVPIYHFGGGTNQNYRRHSTYLQMRNGIRFCLKNRSAMHAFLRALRIFDLACNPWPLTYDKQDVAHRRMRNSGNVAVNFWLWMRAVSWNVVQIPRTLRIRGAERQLILKSRAARKDLTESRQDFDAAPEGRLTSIPVELRDQS